jgi:hypothetical protein
MSKLAWDQVGERKYETGVDHGVLYIPDGSGAYNTGFAWNGLTTVTESPSGAESNPQYADNQKYLNLLSAEEFGGTIEAFTYPLEFGQCDGTAAPQPGVYLGQQNRKTFGMSYRTKVGNDLNPEAGFKIHLVYGALAAPSEKAYATINDSPEPIGFSWDFSTTPVEVGTIDGVDYKPSATLVIDSTEVEAAALTNLLDMLYGTEGTDPELPQPAEVIALFSGTTQTVTPTAPTFDSGTNTITIPTVAGVEYKINGEVVTGSIVITTDTLVKADPLAGYRFPPVSDDDWLFQHSGA